MSNNKSNEEWFRNKLKEINQAGRKRISSITVSELLSGIPNKYSG